MPRSCHPYNKGWSSGKKYCRKPRTSSWIFVHRRDIVPQAFETSCHMAGSQLANPMANESVRIRFGTKGLLGICVSACTKDSHYSARNKGCIFRLALAGFPAVRFFLCFSGPVPEPYFHLQGS